MGGLISFVQENLWIVLFILLICVLIIKTVRSTLKWIVVLVLLGGIVYFGYNHIPAQVKEAELAALQEAEAAAKAEAIEKLTAVTDYLYEESEDYSFTLKGKNDNKIYMKGTRGEPTVIIIQDGEEIEVEFSNKLRAFVNLMEMHSD